MMKMKTRVWIPKKNGRQDSGDATSTANTDQERDTYDEEDESNVDTETDNNNPADVKAGAYEREYRRMRKVYV